MDSASKEQFQQNLTQISCGDIDTFRRATDIFLEHITPQVDHQQELSAAILER
jgi:hypothetical protein